MLATVSAQRNPDWDCQHKAAGQGIDRVVWQPAIRTSSSCRQRTGHATHTRATQQVPLPARHEPGLKYPWNYVSTLLALLVFSITDLGIPRAANRPPTISLTVTDSARACYGHDSRGVSSETDGR